jgi:hypothetical protein
MLSTIFADSDWLGGSCCVGFFFFWMLLMGIGQAVSGIGTAAKNVVESEAAQEVGKSVLAAWLESFFKK